MTIQVFRNDKVRINGKILCTRRDTSVAPKITSHLTVKFIQKNLRFFLGESWIFSQHSWNCYCDSFHQHLWDSLLWLECISWLGEAGKHHGIVNFGNDLHICIIASFPNFLGQPKIVILGLFRLFGCFVNPMNVFIR